MPPPFFTHFILVEEITTIIKIKCALAYSNKILNWMHYEWHARTQDDDEGNAVRWRLIVIYLCTYFRIQSVFWTTSNYNVWNQANVIAIIIIWLAFFLLFMVCRQTRCSYILLFSWLVILAHGIHTPFCQTTYCATLKWPFSQFANFIQLLLVFFSFLFKYKSQITNC